MLPIPASGRQRRKIQITTPTRKRLTDALRRRSRITNLGVLLLSILCTISLLYNIHHWVLSSSADLYGAQQSTALQTLLTTTERSPAVKELTHLIIVPCHSIWLGPETWTEESDWLLESYQKGRSRVSAFYEHIAKSTELTKQDPKSLLIFSGGQTKSTSSSTEAESYLRLAQKANLLPKPTNRFFPFARVTTENHALDSFQNLLFSIARFREFTGHFPAHITVVGYEFKRPRFTELHRAALRWPEDKFEYVGLDPPDAAHLADAMRGEQENGYLPYTFDTYGCHSVLLNKRRQRNPYARFHPYHASSPELGPLLNWCPETTHAGRINLFSGKLPWARTTSFLRDNT